MIESEVDPETSSIPAPVIKIEYPKTISSSDICKKLDEEIQPGGPLADIYNIMNKGFPNFILINIYKGRCRAGPNPHRLVFDSHAVGYYLRYMLNDYSDDIAIGELKKFIKYFRKHYGK